MVRAIYDWIVDNDLTPELLVAADVDGVDVPVAHVHDGQIVLNVSPSAVVGLEIGNEWVSFSARFAGRAQHIKFPTRAVKSITARENRAGMSFPAQEPEGDPPEPAGPGGNKSAPSRPALRVVK